MITKKIKVGDEVWLMFDNKPCKGKIYKITTEVCVEHTVLTTTEEQLFPNKSELIFNLLDSKP